MFFKERWRDVERLPISLAEDWSVLEKGVASDIAFENLKERIRKWLPASALLVAYNKGRFMPPVLFEVLEKEATDSVLKATRMWVFAFFAFFSAFYLFHIISPLPTKGLLMTSLGGIFLAVVMLVELKIFLNKKNVLIERSLFFYWMRVDVPSKRAHIILCGCVFLIGLLQVIVQSRLGGVMDLIYNYGVSYAGIRRGELWRFVIGPYFHYSLSHFITNVALLILISRIVLFSAGFWFCLFSFVGCVLVSSMMQVYFGGQAYDNFAGISGGVYALYGVLFGIHIMDGKALPKGLAFNLFLVALMGIVYSEITSKAAATVAHLSGLALGILVVVCGCLVRRAIAGNFK